MRRYAVNEGNLRIGEDHPRARYTNTEIDLVLKLRGQGDSYGEIARKMDMPKATVQAICNGRSRCQVPAQYRTEQPPPTRNEKTTIGSPHDGGTKKVHP